MIRIYLCGVILLSLAACEKTPYVEPSVYNCFDESRSKGEHIKQEQLEDLIHSIRHSGVPGIMMTVRDRAGNCWSGTAGKADLESDVDLQPCHITRVGSTVKTFTAVTLLLLAEEGKLNLDDRASQYLPAEYLDGLANAEVATIRQLLQHSSGIPNYIVNPRFQTASLNNLTKTWQPEELLSYARNQSADFAPGTDVRYSNTNYILLGDIISVIEGKPFYKTFEEKLFIPLGLSKTRFAAEDPIPTGIIRGYVDFYSNHQLINATDYSGWDYFTADGGLISNTGDISTFLNQLFAGAILSEASLAEMMDWQAPGTREEEGFKTSYGLGIFRIVTDFGPAYLHSGDAIGYFASMVHFPDRGVTISWAVNGNYGALDDGVQSKKAMERIFRTVLE